MSNRNHHRVVDLPLNKNKEFCDLRATEQLEIEFELKLNVIYQFYKSLFYLYLHPLWKEMIQLANITQQEDKIDWKNYCENVDKYMINSTYIQNLELNNPIDQQIFVLINLSRLSYDRWKGKNTNKIQWKIILFKIIMNLYNLWTLKIEEDKIDKNTTSFYNYVENISCLKHVIKIFKKIISRNKKLSKLDFKNEIVEITLKKWLYNKKSIQRIDLTFYDVSMLIKNKNNELEKNPDIKIRALLDKRYIYCKNTIQTEKMNLNSSSVSNPNKYIKELEDELKVEGNIYDKMFINKLVFKLSSNNENHKIFWNIDDPLKSEFFSKEEVVKMYNQYKSNLWSKFLTE